MPEGADETVEFQVRHTAPSPATVPLPTFGEQRTPPSQLGLIFLAVAAGALLAGIAVASVTRPDADGEVVVDERVGAAGATIEFDDGEIRIPANALDVSTRIVVRKTVVQDRVRVRPPDGESYVFEPDALVAYRFEPADVSFERRVEIVFDLRGGAQNGAVFARVGENTVLLPGDVDGERGVVTVEVRDFRFAEPESSA